MTIYSSLAHVTPGPKAHWSQLAVTQASQGEQM